MRLLLFLVLNIQIGLGIPLAVDQYLTDKSDKVSFGLLVHVHASVTGQVLRQFNIN